MRSTTGPVRCGAAGAGGRYLRFRIWRSHRATRSDLRPQGHSKRQQADASDSKLEMLAPENRSEVLCAAVPNVKAAPPKPNLFAPRRPGRDGLWA